MNVSRPMDLRVITLPGNGVPAAFDSRQATAWLNNFAEAAA